MGKTISDSRLLLFFSLSLSLSLSPSLSLISSLRLSYSRYKSFPVIPCLFISHSLCHLYSLLPCLSFLLPDFLLSVSSCLSSVGYGPIFDTAVVHNFLSYFSLVHVLPFIFLQGFSHLNLILSTK